MEILMVRIKVKPQHLEDYIREMIGDAAGSVADERGCRRFDIIQDKDDPTKIGLCEVYNDIAAFDDHLTRPHFLKWQEATKDWVEGEIGVSKCRPVFPVGDGLWDSARPKAVEDEAFNGSLFVIHAPLWIKSDRVEDFIEAVSLDAIGSVNEEPGCLRFDVYRNRENPNELYLYEVYVNEDAFEYHRKTPHIKRWSETVKDWYDQDQGGKPDAIRGANIWPPDNWNWSSGKPDS